MALLSSLWPAAVTASPPLRRGRIAVVAVVVAGVLVAGSPATAQPAEDFDPGVRSAMAGREAAAATLSVRQAELDAAAAAYEAARAHHLRLLEEADAAERAAAEARRRAAMAADDATARAVALYKHPSRGAGLADVVVGAPDAATALHRAQLVERMTARAVGRAAGAGRAAAGSSDQLEQHRILQAGTAGAAADRQRRADALAAAVAAAEQALDDADAGVDAARAEARRLAEERAAAEAAAQAAAAAAAAAGVAAADAAALDGVGPGRSVGGRVCPIAAPNAFIDSWGFPRSGGRTHKGVDMFAAYGAPLFAVSDAVVTRVGTNRLGGLSIWLTDANGDRFYYAHLAQALVQTGQVVRVGQVIGRNGNSGNAISTPPHVHWQVHPGGGPPVNPYPLAASLCR